MITDAQLRFSNDQSLAGAAGTVVSTNTVDLLSPNKNPGLNSRAQIAVLVTTAFLGGTSVRAEVIESANEDLSSPTVLLTGPTVLTANAKSGARLIDAAVPNSTKQYLGIRYTTVGTFTAGGVFAGIVETIDHQPYVPSNSGR